VTTWGASPLRYPGGKAELAPFLAGAVRGSPIDVICEPFAGGAGASLRLLLDEYVDAIVLNDIEPGIAAFWRAVFNCPNDLAERIESTETTIDEWHRQHEIATTKGAVDNFALGFATFYLNRTNRSGILRGRPIGGLGQNGPWKIDARFNRTELARRVRRLGLYRNRVTVLEEDGAEVVRRHLGTRTLVYADPPYLVRGGRLYLNAMSWEDHSGLAAVLRQSEAPWVVTYDRDPRVVELYPNHRRAEFGLTHSAGPARTGREYAVFSTSVSITDLAKLGQDAYWCRQDAVLG
jgi:DNA adenine methylase